MTAQLPEVAQALLDPKFYPDKTTRVEMMQTQMSFIFLTGKYVYKVKKPVNLGYLDYTTLEQRHYFCDQEVKLNRRLCPEAYLGVIPIMRESSEIRCGGEGEVIDYAVKMLYLPQDRMMNILLDRNRVTLEMVEQVAQKMVDFHSKAATDPTISNYGKIEAVRVNTEENFSQTEKYTGIAISANQFQRIKDYTNGILQEKISVFTQRAGSGKIKDCHGDLHAAHICFSDSLCIYDCIEFNDRFRYCDVASEIAFLAMDLDHYGRADLSRGFSEAYIRISGDTQISELLKFYKGYRAYVRGKVACFKLDDPYVSEMEREQARENARSYFELAEAYARSRPLLFITVGLVGSGKSTLSYALAKRLGLTVISSDVVRKQLANIPPTEHHFEGMESGIYSADFSRQTYDKLFSEARNILNQGDSVILDASFIKADERLKARKLAEETGADFRVLECTLDETNTRQRLSQRLNNSSVSDGRWEIYEPQKNKFDPVNEVSPEQHFIIDSAKPMGEQIERVINEL
jgi:uncharacterized protein